MKKKEQLVYPRTFLHVLDSPCTSCVFKQEVSPIDADRFKQLMIEWKKKDTYQECHHGTMAGEHVMCRGFWNWAEKTHQEPTVMQLGQRLDLVVEVPQADLDKLTELRYKKRKK